jgi:hypothetical protein
MQLGVELRDLVVCLLLLADPASDRLGQSPPSFLPVEIVDAAAPLPRPPQNPGEVIELRELGNLGKSTEQGDATSPAPSAPSSHGEARFWPEARKALLEMIDVLNPWELPWTVLDVALGPVREANLLLPERLDPFADNVRPASAEPVETPQNPQATASFKPSEQHALLGGFTSARADTPDELAKWSWRIEAGGSFRQGNTSNTNLRSQFQAERHSLNSDLLAKAGANYNRNTSDVVNRRAFGELLIDRNLRGRWIWYGRQELEYDEVRLLDLRSISSSGIGFRFIDKLDQRLVVRTGPTGSYFLYDPRAMNNSEFRTGWIVEGDYRRRLGDAIRLEWTSAALPDFDSEQQLRLRSEGALLFPIGGARSAWNWKLGAKYEYQFDPVDETKSNDVEGYFAISYMK